MTSNDAVNSAILDALNEVVDCFRRSGAPISVHSEGNVTVARIASIEFAVTTRVERGLPKSLGISCKPVDEDVEADIPVEGLATRDIRELVKDRFRDHMDRLAARGVHPAHDLQRLHGRREADDPSGARRTTHSRARR